MFLTPPGHLPARRAPRTHRGAPIRPRPRSAPPIGRVDVVLGPGSGQVVRLTCNTPRTTRISISTAAANDTHMAMPAMVPMVAQA